MVCDWGVTPGKGGGVTKPIICTIFTMTRAEPVLLRIFTIEIYIILQVDFLFRA